MVLSVLDNSLFTDTGGMALFRSLVVIICHNLLASGFPGTTRLLISAKDPKAGLIVPP